MSNPPSIDDDKNIEPPDFDSVELIEETEHFDSARADLALVDLAADAERCDGKLKREDIERLYFKRKLSIKECAFVEINLKNSGVIIEEEAEVPISAEELAGSSGSVIDFFSRASKAPYLSEVEERECGRTIQIYLRALNASSEHDQITSSELKNLEKRANAARTRFIVSNLRWVAKIATKQRLYGNFDVEDLIQEGTLGLMRSTDKFDPEMGFRFKTYATWWIKHEMDRATKDKSRTIRLPVHVHDRLRKMIRLRASFVTQNGKEPTYDELGKAMGITAEQAAALSWHADSSDVRSLDDELGEDFSLADTVADESTPNAHHVAEEKELHALLAKQLASLTPRQERILRSRFGIDLPDGATLEEIGKEYGLTRERIRQIEAKALRQLIFKPGIKNLRHWLKE